MEGEREMESDGERWREMERDGERERKKEHGFLPAGANEVRH